MRSSAAVVSAACAIARDLRVSSDGGAPSGSASSAGSGTTFPFASDAMAPTAALHPSGVNVAPHPPERHNGCVRYVTICPVCGGAHASASNQSFAASSDAPRDGRSVAARSLPPPVTPPRSAAIAPAAAAAAAACPSSSARRSAVTTLRSTSACSHASFQLTPFGSGVGDTRPPPKPPNPSDPDAPKSPSSPRVVVAPHRFARASTRASRVNPATLCAGTLERERSNASERVYPASAPSARSGSRVTALPAAFASALASAWASALSAVPSSAYRVDAAVMMASGARAFTALVTERSASAVTPEKTGASVGASSAGGGDFGAACDFGAVAGGARGAFAAPAAPARRFFRNASADGDRRDSSSARASSISFTDIDSSRRRVSSSTPAPSASGARRVAADNDDTAGDGEAFDAASPPPPPPAADIAAAARCASRLIANALFLPANGPFERCIAAGRPSAASAPGVGVGNDGGFAGVDLRGRSTISPTTLLSVYPGPSDAAPPPASPPASPPISPPRSSAAASEEDAFSASAASPSSAFASCAPGSSGGAPPCLVTRTLARCSSLARNARWSSRSWSSVSAPRTRDSSAIARDGRAEGSAATDEASRSAHPMKMKFARRPPPTSTTTALTFEKVHSPAFSRRRPHHDARSTSRPRIGSRIGSARAPLDRRARFLLRVVVARTDRGRANERTNDRTIGSRRAVAATNRRYWGGKARPPRSCGARVRAAAEARAPPPAPAAARSASDASSSASGRSSAARTRRRGCTSLGPIRGRRGSAAGPTERGEGAKSGDHREGEGEQEAAKGRERLELELELELVLFEFVLEFFELFERIGFLVVFELVVFV
eukprot:28550-Pelagococcus_subviridis.AAC.1